MWRKSIEYTFLGNLIKLACAYNYLSFIAIFLHAALTRGLSPFVPFISDAAVIPPITELSFMFLNVIAVTSSYFWMTRYWFLKEVMKNEDELLHIANKYSAIAAVLSMVGLSVLATYGLDEESNLFGHFSGTGLMAAMFTVYICAQTWISYKMKAPWLTDNFLRLRLFLTAAHFCFINSMMAFGAFSFKSYFDVINQRWRGEEINLDNIDAEFNIFGTTFNTFKLLSWCTVSEWMWVFNMMAYVATLAFEYTRLDFTFSISTKEDEKKIK